MEHHEIAVDWGGPFWGDPEPVKVFVCEYCGMEFVGTDDLNVHLFNGHIRERPVLMLRGRECGRSRVRVISPTQPEDWDVHNAESVLVNGRKVEIGDVGSVLSQRANETSIVTLQGHGRDQEFEFTFSYANDRDLDGVDQCLEEFLGERSMKIDSIGRFIDSSRRFPSARHYADGLAEYFYGVLAREGSPDSGLGKISGTDSPYRQKFDSAASVLSQYDRPASEAICGLVAFHYNQFEVALTKTRSPRVARVSHRLASVLKHMPFDKAIDQLRLRSPDYRLSDSETEKVLSWSSIKLDGSAVAEVREMESALESFEMVDQFKLRLIAAEHHLVTGNLDATRRHVDALRHKPETEDWVTSLEVRLGGQVK